MSPSCRRTPWELGQHTCANGASGDGQCDARRAGWRATTQRPDVAIAPAPSAHVPYVDPAQPASNVDAPHPTNSTLASRPRPNAAARLTGVQVGAPQSDAVAARTAPGLDYGSGVWTRAGLQ